MAVVEDDNLFAVEGLGKPCTFRRFKCDESLSTWWSNGGTYPDGLRFIPNQAIKLSGFSTFAATTESCYEMKYEIKINDTVHETRQINSPPFEDKYFCRVKLEELADVPAGANLDITVWIAKNIASNSYVTTYSGNGGDQYENMENENKGLFKLEANPQSSNGTSVWSGHFPEIYYYLC